MDLQIMFLLFNFSQKKCSIMILFVCFSSWSLDNSDRLLKALEIPKNASMCNLYPEDYKRLFEALQNSDLFAETFFHDEVLASTRTMNL